MSDSVEYGPSRIAWPPILYLAAAAAAAVLAYMVPLPWIGSPLADLLFAAGWILVVGAAMMAIAAVSTLHRAKTTVMATRSARHLVTTGPYAFTRNPIYLGMTTLLFAIGLIAGSLWFILASVAAALSTQKLSIEPEEQHLEQRFGKHYRDYRKRVRRWI